MKPHTLFSIRWPLLADAAIASREGVAQPARQTAAYCLAFRARTAAARRRSSPHANSLRNRRPAQRRQVHPVQRPHGGGHAAENYPFCTIDPNVGVVPVPDARLGRWPRIAKPREDPAGHRASSSTSPAWCAGASKGEGLGNKFLANIRETDAIAHVVRCFENADVVHVAGRSIRSATSR